MNNFNYFFTPVGSGYKKKFARNVGIAVLILFAFYGVMNLFLDTNYVVESESKITDSLTIPNAERDAKLAAGYKLYPGVGWVHSDDFGDQKPIYKTHPDNPSELILDIDAMLQYQKFWTVVMQLEFNLVLDICIQMTLILLPTVRVNGKQWKNMKMKTKFLIITCIALGLGVFTLAYAQSQEFSSSGRDYVPYTENYNVSFTHDGKIDYDLLIAKIMPEIFQKNLRIEHDVYISVEDIVLNRGPQRAIYQESSYNCGYVIDYADNQVYWLEAAINSTDIQYTKIFTETPTPESIHGHVVDESNYGWCFGPLKQQVAAIFLEEKSYFADDQEAFVAAAIKHELRGNPNLNNQEFTVGKFNFDYGENVVSFCGEFQKPKAGLKYFGGSLKNNVLTDFHLDDKLSPLCAMGDDAKIHSIKVNQKSDVPPDLQAWKNLRMETVFLKQNSIEKLLERNYMFPETMRYNIFEYSAPFTINLIEFVPEDSNTIWNFEPTAYDTFAKIRVPENGGNYYMMYGPNDWNQGDLLSVLILVDGIEVDYKEQPFIRAPDAPYPQHHTDYIFKVPTDSSSIEMVLFIENYVPEKVDDDEYQYYTPRN